MGAVYQAWDGARKSRRDQGHRPEAMAIRRRRELERRFKRELLLARQVTHKNVVRIHDLGEIDGIKYITMPYVQGEDLATHPEERGRAADRAGDTSRGRSPAASCAHDAGVVHRDLKPANIMIDDRRSGADHGLRDLRLDFGRDERAGGRRYEAGRSLNVKGRSCDLRSPACSRLLSALRRRRRSASGLAAVRGRVTAVDGRLESVLVSTPGRAGVWPDGGEL